MILLPPSRGLITAIVSLWDQGTPNSVIQPLQKIPNFAARLTLLAPPLYTSPGKTALASLFRMCKVWSRVYVFQCYKWFWSCLPLWTAACLHSVSYTMLFFWHLHAGDPTIEMQDLGFHTFSCFGPHIWNSLPQELVRHCWTLSSFKAKLKTFRFSQYFCPS